MSGEPIHRSHAKVARDNSNSNVTPSINNSSTTAGCSSVQQTTTAKSNANTTYVRRTSTSSGTGVVHDEEAGCPSLAFDDSDIDLENSYYIYEDDDDDDDDDDENDDANDAGKVNGKKKKKASSAANEAAAAHANMEFEFDVEPQSATRETNVQLQYRDIAEHQIVEVFGDDRYGRRVVCVTACRIPEGGEFSPQRFLQYLLNLLDLYVENDYTLVYFHHGMTRKNRLPLKWLFQAYRVFDRKYKKNLKALYIVHPTSFIKIVYGMFKSVISYKFGQKVMYIRSLSELSQHIDLSQINIPEPVLEHDAEIVAQYRASHPSSTGKGRGSSPLSTSAPSSSSSAAATLASAAAYYDATDAAVMQPLATQQFGVSLDFLKARNNGQVIPAPLGDAVNYIRSECMQTKHIFRRSANVKHVKEVQAAYNQGRPVHYEEYHDPHLPPVILKTFLRKLPVPLLTFDAYEHVLKLCTLPASVDRAAYLKSTVIDRLPEDNFIILKYVMNLVYDISKTPEAELNTQALAIIFGPNLVWARDQTTDLSSLNSINAMTLVLIENHDLFFGPSSSSAALTSVETRDSTTLSAMVPPPPPPPIATASASAATKSTATPAAKR